MFAKNTPRLLIIGFILLWAIWALFPTIEYSLLSDEEKEMMREDGTLADLESKIIHQGLDLKGGMHIVLEVDIPTLIENIANNKNDLFNEVFNSAKEKSIEMGQDFIPIFIQEAADRNLRLSRHYIDLVSDSKDIESVLQDQAIDAIDRTLEILQNRIDQFGVSEPIIQKQGDRRIIVELAGIDDPERARGLLQSTALLEFVLIKDPEITQNLLTRIDNVLKGSEELEDVLGQADQVEETEYTTEVTESRIADEQEISLSELFGEVEVSLGDESDASGVLVDRQLFEKRPFSALLRNIRGDIGVPERNIYAVNKILKMVKVQSLLATGDSRFAWGNSKETFSTVKGREESFYHLYHLEAEAGLTGGVITEAKATIGGTESQAAGQFVVSLGMNSEGAKTWSRLTGANIGRKVAIVLDKKVHMAPVIRSKITQGQTTVEGFANMDEAKDIAIVLRAGALPAPVNIIEERTIGPSLGHDSIEKGTRSILIGFALVLIFMVVYYRKAGLIADFALIWNILLVLAILATLRATLTLPGIAGLILTVGMAVDANVIIFERIREELLKGKTVRAAVDSGYARALTTIIDANVTTIIAALVLMQFGTGPVKGFAIVLFWGVTISMFTAIFLTRTFFNMMTARRTLTTLSI